MKTELAERIESEFRTNTRYFEIMTDHHAKTGVGLEPEMKDLVLGADGGVVLDAGCGEGSIINWIARHGVYDRCVGVDISPIGVEMGRRNDLTRTVEYHTGNLRKLPFDDGSFDVVYSQSVLEHVADYGAVLREMRRVLRPGGLLAIRTGNGGRSDADSILGAAVRYLLGRNEIREEDPTCVLDDEDLDHRTNFDTCHIPSDVLVRDLKALGFEIERFTTRFYMIRDHAKNPLDALIRNVVTSLPVFPLPHLGPTIVVGARKPR